VIVRSVFVRSATVRPIFARFPFAFALVLGGLFSVGLSVTLSAEEIRTPPVTGPTLIMRQAVWQAVISELRQRGFSGQRLPRIEDIDLPAALPGLGGRKLRVLSECWDEGPRRTQFRLQCGEAGQCLPFLVYVRSDARNYSSHDFLNADAGARAGLCRVASGSHPAPGSRLATEGAPTAASQPLVRAGDPARAVFLSDGFRMTASVTCLERGREGEVIRVRGPEGHVFRARISGPGLLEALPQ
jgi:hypothetical protein